MPGASGTRLPFAKHAALWLMTAGLIAACSREAPLPPQQAVDVTAITIEPKDAPVVYEFVGQTQSSHEVEIRARVNGFLEKRVYTEGALVKAGQTLWVDRAEELAPRPEVADRK